MSRYFPSYYPPQGDPYSRAYERWPYDYYAQPYDEGYMRPAPYYDPYNTYYQPPYQAPVYPYEPQYQAPAYRAPQYEPQGYGYAPGYPYQYDYQPAYQAPVYQPYEPQYQAPMYPAPQYEQQVWAPQYQQPQYPVQQPAAPQYQQPYQQPVAPAAPYQAPYQPQQYAAPQPQYQQNAAPYQPAPQPQYQQQAPVYPEAGMRAPQNEVQYQPAPSAPVYQPAPVAAAQVPSEPKAPAAPQFVPAEPAAFAPQMPETPAPAFVPQPAAPIAEAVAPAAPVAEPAAPAAPVAEFVAAPAAEIAPIAPQPVPAAEIAQEKPAQEIQQEMLEKSYLAQFAPAPMHYNPVPKKQDETHAEETVEETYQQSEIPAAEPAPAEEQTEAVAEEDVFVFAPPRGLDLSMGYLFRSFEEKLQEVSETQEVVEEEQEIAAVEPQNDIDEMIAELDELSEEPENETAEYEVFDLESEFAPEESEEETLEDIIREVMQEPAAAEEPQLFEEAAAEPAHETVEEEILPEQPEEEVILEDEPSEELISEEIPAAEEEAPSEEPEEEFQAVEFTDSELIRLQELLAEEEAELYGESEEEAAEAAEGLETESEPDIFENAAAMFAAFDLASDAIDSFELEEAEDIIEAEDAEEPAELEEQPAEDEILAEELPEEAEQQTEETVPEEAAEEAAEAEEVISEEPAEQEVEPAAESESEPTAGMDYEDFGFPDPTTTRELSRRQIMEALEEKLRAEQQAEPAPALNFETGEFIFPDLDEEEESELDAEPEAAAEAAEELAEPVAEEPVEEVPEEAPAEAEFSFDDAFSEIDRIEEELKKAVVLRDYVDCYSENNLFSYKQRACFEVVNAISEYNIQYGDLEPQPLFEDVSFVIPAGSCTAVVSEEPSAVYELVRYLGTRHGAEEAAPSGVWPEKVIYIDGSEDIASGSVLDYLASHAGEENRSICGALLTEIGLSKIADEPMSSMDEGKRALLAMLAAETDPDVDAVVVNFEELDPQQEDISRFGRIVGLLCRQGTSVVLGCCSADLAGECANYVVALVEGKPEFSGSYIDFTNKYCTRIMNFDTDDDNIVVQMSRRFSDLRFELSGNTVTVCGDAGSAELAEQLIEAVLDLGVDMDHVVMVPKTFEAAVEEMLA